METRLTLAQRVYRMEADLAYLRAIVDGGEVQSREAVVAVIGLMASFVAKSGALDYDRLIAFLSDGTDQRPQPEDRTEMLLHGVRLILAYYRDLDKGTLKPPIPSPATLGADENGDILRRAFATLEFEREALIAETDRPRARKGRPRGGTEH